VKLYKSKFGNLVAEGPRNIVGHVKLMRYGYWDCGGVLQLLPQAEHFSTVDASWFERECKPGGVLEPINLVAVVLVAV